MAEVEGEGGMPDNVVQIWSSHCRYTKCLLKHDRFAVDTDVSNQIHLNAACENYRVDRYRELNQVSR